MYKHNASSIKETAEKQFVSLTEKEKWASAAPKVHDHNNTYYTKAELDSMIDSADVQLVNDIISVPNMTHGRISSMDIYGETKQKYTKTRTNIHFTYGDLSTENGQELESSEKMITDFVTIDKEFTIVKYLKGYSIRDYTVFLYNNQKEFIGYELVTNYKGEFLSPLGCKYIRILVDNPDHAYLGNISLETPNFDTFISSGDRDDDDRKYINVVKRGKNLCDNDLTHAAPHTLNGLDSIPTHEEDGSWTLKAITAHHHGYGFKVYLNKDIRYYFSCKVNADASSPLWIGIHSEKGVQNIRYYVHENTQGNTDVKWNFTINEDGLYYIALQNNANPGSTPAVLCNVRDIMLSTEDIEYEPFTEEKTRIELPFALEGIGEHYKDRLFVNEKGTLCVEKKITTYTITGNESFIMGNPSPVTGNTEEYIGIICQLDTNCNSNVGRNHISAMSTILPSVPDASLYDIGMEGVCTQTLRPNVWFMFNKKRGKNGTLLSTIDEMKELVIGSTIKYPVETPEIIEINDIRELFVSVNKGENLYMTIDTGNETTAIIDCKIPQSLTGLVDDTSDKIRSLKQQVEKISNNNSESMSLVAESDLGRLSISNTYNTYANNVKLGGKSVINYGFVQDVSRLVCAGVKTQDVVKTIEGETLKWTLEPNSDGSITSFYPQIILSKDSIGAIKPGKRYTISYTIEASHDIEYGCRIANYDAYQMNTGFEEYDLITSGDLGKGVKKFVKFSQIAKQPTEPSETLRIGFGMVTVTDEAKWVKISNLIIHEGKIDTTQCGYSPDRVMSVDNLVINTCNENLFGRRPNDRGNCNYELIGEGSIRSYVNTKQNEPSEGTYFKYFEIDAEPNTTYCVSMDTPEVISGKPQVVIRGLRKSDIDKHDIFTHNLIKAETLLDSSRTVVTFKTNDCIGHDHSRMAIALYSTSSGAILNPNIIYRNISIKKIGASKNPDKYSKNENFSKTIILPEPLRSIPGTTIRDTIEKVDGRYVIIRRCGQVRFTGDVSEPWRIDTSEDLFNETTCFFNMSRLSGYFKEKIPKSYGFCGSNLIVDGKAWHATNTKECICIDCYFDIRVMLSGLSTPDVNGLRKWLSENNVEFIYELESEIIEELNDDIQIRLFDGVTNIIAKGGSANPSIFIDYSNNISNTIMNMMNRVDTIERNQLKLNGLLLSSLYEAEKTSYRLNIAVFNNKNTKDVEESVPEDKTYESIDYDIYDLIYNVIYNNGLDIQTIENIIDFYTITSKLSISAATILFDELYSRNEVIEN